MVNKICAIVPTVREFKIIKEYFENAVKYDFDTSKIFLLFVTEDFCDSSSMKGFIKDSGIEGHVFNESERYSWFKEMKIEEFYDIIPKKSHSETSFGLLWMFQNKEFDCGIFIDDDTLPNPNFNFFGEHIKNLEFEGKLDVVESDKKFVNVLYQNFQRHRFYPRGYPYSRMKENISIKNMTIKDVYASQGLWTNMPDLDAIRILMNGGLKGLVESKTILEDFKNNFVVENKNYLTVCSMNLAFRREIIPAFYQLPMADNPWKIDRFDDIWSGFIIKRILDETDKNIVNGFPLCIHNKAERSTFKDLFHEVNGLEINEHLCEILDKIEFESKDFLDMYKKIAQEFIEGNWKYLNGEFINYMGRKMQKWAECLEKLA